MRSEHAKTLKKSADKTSQKEKIQKRNRDKVLTDKFVIVHAVLAVLSDKKEEALLQDMAEMGEDSLADIMSMDELTFRAQFSFVQEGRGSAHDFERITESARKEGRGSAHDFERITESARKVMGEGHPLIQILRRGIGVHHSGLQNKYRMAVEMLFRCGFLRLVVATETLAYGINMPCRSVVFAGDHVSLNSIQYQQMSGRAGRRGLDVLGHVIFLDVPQHKMHRLVVAPVPSLQGHFPLSASSLLRLISLLTAVVRLVKGAHGLPCPAPAAVVRLVKGAVVRLVKGAVCRALRQPLFANDHPSFLPVLPIQIRYMTDFLVCIGVLSPSGAT
ncbi:P-loop containing nucleoside triphosphate hydrolase protein [Baffinella frigidus]|nr:P-loop containing nucleoside triphosphate hydrolase protein [Cryptophyta sp. CCMP2293]